MQQRVPQRPAVTAADDQDAMRIRVGKERNVNQRLMVGELFVQARLERPGQNQRPAGTLEVDNLERLPRCSFSVQSLEDAIPLLEASEGRLGKPVVQRYAEYAGAGFGVVEAPRDAGTRSSCGRSYSGSSI